MQIIKKIPSECKFVVNDIEYPTFIYYDQRHTAYDYNMNCYKNYNGIQLMESNYTYVIRMKSQVFSTTYQGFFVFNEKDNKDYLKIGYLVEYYDVNAMPKMSSLDFLDFFQYIQNGILKPVEGYFECNFRVIKKGEQYFLKFSEEDNKELFLEELNNEKI